VRPPSRIAPFRRRYYDQFIDRPAARAAARNTSKNPFSERLNQTASFSDGTIDNPGLRATHNDLKQHHAAT
jgi:hypothetical protein